jgi:hypothetical protein
VRIRRLEMHARVVDHQWPPKWVGPWIGVQIHRKETDLFRCSRFMFDAHAQLHLVPSERSNGIQTGLILVYFSRGDYRIRYGKNWWSPRYGKTGRLV